jgi:protocatechuate 3,4-dioxygenase beta subunit
MIQSLPSIVSLIVLSAFLQAQTVSPSTPAEFRISGTVVNALTGQVLADTEVSIGRSRTADTLQSITTGDDGRFQFSGLATGKYWLAAQGRGFRRQSFEEHQGFFTGIAVGPALQSDNLVFRLSPEASISGTVTDDQNDPVREAQVTLFHSGVENGTRITQNREQATTDDRGHYHFSHLEPGKYFVAVSARAWYAESQSPHNFGLQFPRGNLNGGDAPQNPEADNSGLDVAYPLTFYAGSTDASAATPVLLRAGDHADADVSLTPVRAIHLRIQVPNSDGVSAEKQQVSTMITQRLFDGTEIPVTGQTMQKENGEFEISGIAPGQFEVTMQSYGKDPKSWAQTVNLAGDSEISVTGNASTGTVSGAIQLDGQALQQQAFIQFQSSNSAQSFGAQVSANGEFTVAQSPAKPGIYEVSVFNVPGAIVGSLAATGAKVVGRTVEISGTGPVQLTVTLARRLGVVNGTALRNDKPASGAMVVLVPSNFEKNNSLFRRDQSDSDGTFTLPSVLPGKYTLLAIQNGWDMEWSNPAVLLPFMKEGESIEVPPDGKLQVQVKVQ